MKIINNSFKVINTNTIVKNDLFDSIKYFENYLKHNRIKEEFVKTYIRIIHSYIEKGCSYNDLVNMIIDNVDSYFNKRQSVNKLDYEKKAFLHFIEFVLEEEGYGHIYISYNSGWSSFVPNEKHITGYVIDGRNITKIFNFGFNFGHNESKKMDRISYIVLRLLFRNREQYLSCSNNAIMTNHGPLRTYSYLIKGIRANNCATIFSSTSTSDQKYVDKINMEYIDIIDKIIY
jgi:hypothetical protein